MAKLVYTALMSMDGYIQDKDGNFDWATPDAEAHAFINDIERGVDTYLYGRRMYEVMAVWQTMPTADDPRALWITRRFGGLQGRSSTPGSSIRCPLPRRRSNDVSNPTLFGG